MGSTFSQTLTGDAVPSHVYSNVLKHLETISTNFPEEFKTFFVHPLKWETTAITVVDHRAFEDADDYEVEEIVKPQRTISRAMSNMKHPRKDQKAFIMTADTSGKFSVVECWNLRMLSRHLHHCGKNAIKEIQVVIEANAEPLWNVSGERGNASQILSQFYSKAASGDEDLKRTFELLLLLNRMDLDLLTTELDTTRSSIPVTTMEEIHKQLKILQRLSGSDEICPVISIDWESPFVYEDGSRAPPWRQVHGDLAYITATTVDSGVLTITGAKHGFFVNRGHYLDDQGQERINYEAAGDTWPSLQDCLKAHSEHFDNNIDNQQHTHQEPSHPAPPTPDIVNQQLGIERKGSPLAQHKSTEGDESEEEFGSIIDGLHQRLQKTDEEAPSKDSTKEKDFTQLMRPQIPHVPHRTSPLADNKTGVGAITSTPADDKKTPRSQLMIKAGLGLTPTPPKQPPSAKPARKKTKKASTPRKSVSARSPRKSRFLSTRSGAPKPVKKRIQEEDEDEDTDPDEITARELSTEPTITQEYIQIQKTYKFMSEQHSQTATILAICTLQHMELDDEKVQLGIYDVDGISPLVNYLAGDSKLRNGSLKVLVPIAENRIIQRAFAHKGGIPPTIKLLYDEDEENKKLAAQLLALVSNHSPNRHRIRRANGLSALIMLLQQAQDEELKSFAARSLSNCCKSSKNRAALLNDGRLPPILSRLLVSENEDLISELVCIVKECAQSEQFRTEVLEAGCVELLLKHLQSSNQLVQSMCANAISRCAEDQATRELISHSPDGMKALLAMMKQPDEDLLANITGAVWKCTKTQRNVELVLELEAIPQLVSLLSHSSTLIKTNVSGALWNCSEHQECKGVIRQANGLPVLIDLLNSTNYDILVNCSGCLGGCATDSESKQTIAQLDGIRMLWSLLKSKDPSVQANAAHALTPLVDNPQNLAIVVQSLMGGLHIMVSLLDSEDEHVQAHVCDTVANIAKAETVVAVMTEQGCLPSLARLTVAKNDIVRAPLSRAIAECCSYANNRAVFGQLGGVVPLVQFLNSKHSDVLQKAAIAIHELSKDPDNSSAFREAGAVAKLVQLIGSKDQILQQAAASALGNIRRFFLERLG